MYSTLFIWKNKRNENIYDGHDLQKNRVMALKIEFGFDQHSLSTFFVHSGLFDYQYFQGGLFVI